jgi:hypothetical protein
MENKSTSSQLPTALRLGNTVTTDKSTIIEHFYGWPCFPPGHPYPVQQPCTPHSNFPSLHHFFFTQIQIAGVLKELQNLDPDKSAELDNLDSLFIKVSAKMVAIPLTSLFNLSFVSSEIPNDWKAAKVNPLFNGGDTLDPN